MVSVHTYLPFEPGHAANELGWFTFTHHACLRHDSTKKGVALARKVNKRRLRARAFQARAHHKRLVVSLHRGERVDLNELVRTRKRTDQAFDRLEGAK